MAQNDDFRAAPTATAMKRSGASAPKTTTYEGISRSTIEHIRMLTIDNTNQKSQLDRLAGVTDLNARRNP